MKSKSKFLVAILIGLYLICQATYSQDDDILFRRHIISSGWNGLLYGVALDLIFELDGAAAVGVPIITAGGSALLPLLTNPSKSITPGSLMLSGHGKSIGWAHGFSIATLIGGEDAWESEENDTYKMTIGLGALTSIGLGILGNSLGKNSNWTEGQMALYRHYGWVMPYTGFSLAAAFSEEPRIFGGAVLLFGAGGYLIADKVNRWNEFTRGDIRATQVLSLLNGGLGYGIFSEEVDFDEDSFDMINWLYPAAGFLSGTIISHLWLKNANMTPQQGLSTGYAAAGGAILGLGIALATGSDKLTPYYMIPYATGLGAYIYMVERIRKKNSSSAFHNVKHNKSWDIALMPQNLIINEKIRNKGFMTDGRYGGMLPLFSASVKF